MFPNLIEQLGVETFHLCDGTMDWDGTHKITPGYLIPHRMANNGLCNVMQSTYYIWWSEIALGLHIALKLGILLLPRV